MTHYTITLNRPESILAERFRKVPGTNQAIAWDGPARKADAVRLYESLAPYCAAIGLFSGKDRGRCIMTQGDW